MQVRALVLNVHSSKIVNQIYFKNIAKKFNLKATELCVLMGLANHYNPTKKEIFPTQEYLAEHLNISEKSVNRAIKRLSEIGLILYETKHNNRYVFTNLFFEALEMSETNRQNVSKVTDKMSDKHDIKHINNKQKNKILNFNQQAEIKYPSPETTRNEIKKTFDIKKGSPLDMDKEQALKWLSTLPEILQNSYFAKEVRKKWNI